MTTAKPAPTPTVRRETLDETPLRALKLLRAVGTSIPIRAALAARGFAEEDHDEGWSLLHAASGYDLPRSFDAIDVEVRDAIRAVDAWDEDGFRVVRASLGRRFPDVAERVLRGIGPSTGPAAVIGVAMLLERLDQLEKGKQKDEHAALALLAKRGIDKNERKRLRALVDKAQSAPLDGIEIVRDEAARATADRDQEARLVALRSWYEEWATIARAAIKRRDYLILLGLASKKSRPRAAAPVAPPTDDAGDSATAL